MAWVPGLRSRTEAPTSSVKHADARQHEVDPGPGRRHRLQGDVDQARLIESQQRVGDPAVELPRMEMRRHFARGPDGDAVESQQHVPRLDPGPVSGLVRRHLGGGDAGRPIDPQHAVDQLVPVGPDEGVGGGEAEEARDQGDGQDRRNPGTPPAAPGGAQGMSRRWAAHGIDRRDKGAHESQ